MKLLTRMAIWAYLMTWAASSIVYNLVGHPHQSPSFKEDINTKTKMICAFQCRSRLCTAFSFEDGLCRMYNIGEGDGTYPSSNVASYKTSQDNFFEAASITRSSVYIYNNVPYDGENAIDGDVTTYFHSAVNDMNPWWCLELSEPAMVKTVRLFPSIKLLFHIRRFNNIEVRVGMNPPNGGDATMNPLLGYYAGPYDNSSCCSVDITSATPVEGRYIHIRRISVPGDETLVFVEMQIFS
ncbi:uncharacterized protein LOC122261153 [Penaeus japonicus]|uniref:uncharacterized protein LOC122261153 n=1 Tax=Penaeus japonicus TaxID=27405 RepID=UPI001C70BE8F|nr:uncharacterized protein LOC122261153 [Penaeus japonicus]